VAAQVRLVAEAGFGRCQAGRYSVEKKPPRQVDAPARHVLMRADPELAAEYPDHVGRVGVQSTRRIPERYLLAEASVDQVTQVIRHAGVRPCAMGLTVLAEVAAEPLGDEGQAVLRLKFLARLIEHVMQLVDAVPQ
jgi:hypothetical protein